MGQQFILTSSKGVKHTGFLCELSQFPIFMTDTIVGSFVQILNSVTPEVTSPYKYYLVLGDAHGNVWSSSIFLLSRACTPLRSHS